jgi:hypothetical protein
MGYRHPRESGGPEPALGLNRGRPLPSLSPWIPALAQGCPGNSCGDKARKIAAPISSWPGSTWLDPAIHALGCSKQRRGYAGQARARRPEIVSCESDASQACRKTFPGQPCAFAEMTNQLLTSGDSLAVGLLACPRARSGRARQVAAALDTRETATRPRSNSFGWCWPPRRRRHRDARSLFCCSTPRL